MAEYNVGSVEISLETKLKEASKQLEKTANDLKKLKKGVADSKTEINKMGKAANNTGKSLQRAFNVGKMYLALNYLRRYSTALGGVVKSSIDYVETVNKFQVSMQGMYKDAMKFQNKINEKFGLSKSILMDYQANFNNILKGLGGLDETAAYGLSESLLKMSIDFSSLFNTSIEEAVTKFQAALTQQVRPIRSVSGFDVTQQTLASLLPQIGIYDRQISSLNQVEKRLLIIVALQKQMWNVGAVSDYANTLEQPANQLKVMKDTLLDIKIVLGNFIMVKLKGILPYLNGILMVIKEIFKTLSLLKLGDVANEKKPPDLVEILDTNGATSGVKNTTKAVKDLKKAVTGIDELNIIAPPTDTGNVGGDVGGIGGVDPRLLQAITDYDSKLENVRMKATEIRDRIMEWLGFHQAGTDELGNYNWELDEGITRFEIIKELLKTLGIIATTMFAGKVLFKIIKLLGFEGEQGTVIGALGFVVLGVKSVIDIFDGWNKLMDGDTSNNLEAIIKLILGGTGLFISLMSITKILTGTKGVINLFKTWGLKIFGVTTVLLITIGLISTLTKTWDKLSTIEKVFGVLGTATALFLGLAVALGAFHSAWSLGLAIGGIVLGIGAVVLATNKAMKDIKSQKRVDNPFTESSYEKAVKGFKGYATGGFPTKGDYFLANENGKPEYVGSMGGKTAVANATQIVDGISIGVSRANERQDNLLRQTNSLLQQLLAKDTNTYLDGRLVDDQLQKSRNSRGFNSVIGGAAYV